ncbi:hypothetical protein [Bradyrhizobium sp. CCBAU 53338]|uniref:hypothetical protein n=1 Tax=Bradyrhizobium sp. CCBAU 53338 TaxID=1325111 RepID=UPI00188A4407|nr:hypothetical protein [Bradyrhizobium sp. CCBAU 53338]QOZ51481.1 hypothetical protein XH90_08885 [Bradyrhizobium sp. CCBAU 53338]
MLDLTAGIKPKVDQLTNCLAAALALEQDSQLRAHLSTIARRPEALALSTKTMTVPVEIASERIELASEHATNAALDGIDFEANSAFKERLRAQIARTRRQAEQLLFPFFSHTSVPSRSEFDALCKWAPTMGIAANELGQQIVEMSDCWREPALNEWAHSGPSRYGAAVRYSALLRMQAHLVLLRSSVRASAGAATVPRSFPLTDHSPTLFLTRERVVWLAAAAARWAASLGTSLVEGYLRVLGSARHEIEVFDALFGLVSIALAHKESREDIARILEMKGAAIVEAAPTRSDYVAAAFRSALGILRRPHIRVDISSLTRLGWKADPSGDGLAYPEAFRLDPTEIGSQGHMLGFAVLPIILGADVRLHYPRSKARVSRLVPPPGELCTLIKRAWSSDLASGCSCF